MLCSHQVLNILQFTFFLVICCENLSNSIFVFVNEIRCLVNFEDVLPGLP